MRGWLGVEPQDITPELAQAFRLQDTHGFLITSVTPRSPASLAGLAAGDVIKSIDGDAVQNSRDALNRIAARPPGTAIKLGGLHNGRKFNLKVTVAERPVQLVQ
jgi:S1-C subfamily serine protease